jgi:hypothetical protein
MVSRHKRSVRRTDTGVRRANLTDWREEEPSPSRSPDLAPDCTFEMDEAYPVGEPVNLWFERSNQSIRPLQVLMWHTPLEGIAGEIFQVTPTELPAAAPTSEPPAGFKQYVDETAGISLWMPESRVATQILPGKSAILQSYPEDK